MTNANWGLLLALGIGAFLLLGRGRGAGARPKQNWELDISHGDFEYD